MAKAYSMDLRIRIKESYENNEGSMRTLAKRFKVSSKFVFTLLDRFKKTGELCIKPYKGGRKCAINIAGQFFIKQLLEAQPDIILEEIREEYNKHFAPVSRSTINRTLNKMNITYKKNFI